MKKQNPLLEIKDLHVSVEDGIKILNGINLTIHPGEIHVIMGPMDQVKVLWQMYYQVDLDIILILEK